MELLSKGTKLAYATAKAGSFTVLYGLQSTPDMGGDPEKVDVTNLNDGVRRYIKGVKEYGDLDFTFYYNDDKENPNVGESEVAASYSTLRAFDKAGTDVWFKLTYPDGTGFLWNGSVSVKRSAAEVNGALKFTLRTTPKTDFEDVTEASAS
ncbi:MAG: phage tail tube protein [Ruminiclostridium sp.]